MDSKDRVWRERGLKDAVLAGDERAWKALYDESFDSLFAYVHWRCGRRRDRTEEIVQETWLTAVRRIRKFEPDRGCFVDWLRGIALNVMRNQWRKESIRAKHEQPIECTSATACPHRTDRETPDDSERIAGTLADLPDRYEAVLRAKYLEQRTVNEISAAWNESPKAVESLLTRARQAFRRAFLELE